MVQFGPYGAYDLERGWAPAPRYILRRHRILQLMKDLPPGDLLEIGCGGGALLRDLAAWGRRCVAVEISEEAYEVAKDIHAGQDRIELHRGPKDTWRGAFDYVLAFEVLEHIQDDAGAVREWVSYLKAGGMILLSVPCHMKKWSASDVGAGHYRRYERRQLCDLLRTCGIDVVHAEIYGFPLGNALDALRARVFARRLRDGDLLAGGGDDAREANTRRSGVDRKIHARAYPVYAGFPCRLALDLCCRIQALFGRSELGTGYLVAGKKVCS
jgi:SAM-dependent methyltransferase